jgi:hypothetical protein
MVRPHMVILSAGCSKAAMPKGNANGRHSDFQLRFPPLSDTASVDIYNNVDYLKVRILFKVRRE